jgi:hypothetical protein
LVFAGSHFDSQPDADCYEGAYGVCTAAASAAFIVEPFAKRNSATPLRNLAIAAQNAAAEQVLRNASRISRELQVDMRMT